MNGTHGVQFVGSSFGVVFLLLLLFYYLEGYNIFFLKKVLLCLQYLYKEDNPVEPRQWYRSRAALRLADFKSAGTTDWPAQLICSLR